MVKRYSSVFGKGKELLTVFVVLLFFNANVNADDNVGLETIVEDFENVTLVDADGQVPANSWTPGVGLSNGWRIINGYIYGNENGDYGLIHSEGGGYGESDYYLTSASTSSNSAYVFIPLRLCGEVGLWCRSTLDPRSTKKSWLKVYEATADGGVLTENELYSVELEKGNSTWQQHSFTIPTQGGGGQIQESVPTDETQGGDDEGKYIAINLVYTDIDSFSATIDSDNPVTPTLTLSASTLDCGTLATEGSLEFSVTSNVTTSVTYSITGADRDAFEVTEAPEVLPAGVEKTVVVKMSASEAGDYQATLKITAGELTEKVTLKGTWEENGQGTDPEEPTADWKGEDFTGLTAIPEGWTIAEGASWTIDEWWIDSAPGLKGSSGFICTPMFTIGQGQTLEFYFQKGMSYGWNSKCTVYYSTDKENWTEVESYNSYTDDGVKSITFPEKGKYYLGLEVNTTTYFDDFRIVGGVTFSFSDIPAIIAAIASGDTSNTYDVNGDGKTDIADIVCILLETE